MADIINSVDRSLDMHIYDLYIYIYIYIDDAVRAVAVAKRREYVHKFLASFLDLRVGFALLLQNLQVAASFSV